MTDSGRHSAGDVLANRYRLDRVVGEGGMGVVWAAAHVETGERVAIKVIKQKESAQLQRRFLREARAAAAVRHPNVVNVREVLELEDRWPAFVMELLEGESLAAHIEREGELSPMRTCSIMLQVLDAVAAAHALGIVHRDLKPENVFLLTSAPEGENVKVLDFGIAKLTAPDGDGVSTVGATTTGSVLGTPCYMSPEQVFGEKDIDERTDIWSLGMILFHCLSGILPTQASNVGQVMKIIITRTSWLVHEMEPNVPSDLDDLVSRMLARTPQERPPLDEVRRVLRRGAAGESMPPVSARPAATNPGLRTDAEPESQRVVIASGKADGTSDTQRVTTTSGVAAPPPRRFGSGTWMMVVVGALVATGVAFLLMSMGASTTPTAPTGVPEVPVSAGGPASAPRASASGPPSPPPSAPTPSVSASAEAAPPSSSGRPAAPRPAPSTSAPPAPSATSLPVQRW